MASTVFKVLSWSPNDPITDEKLQGMVDNDNYLRDNMTRSQYAASGVTKNTGVKIASGFALIAARKGREASRQVGFSNYFSDGSHPIITTSPVSRAQRMIWVTHQGLGSNLLPTRDGFVVVVNIDSTTKKKNITHNFYVAWHALGF
jgi:hypothetical protein